MCKNVIISASFGLIILGITCFGAEEFDFLQLADINDSTDNKVNLRLIQQVVQQYESKLDGKEGEDLPAEENSRKKRSMPEAGSTESYVDPTSNREAPQFGENHSLSKRQTETRRNADDIGLKDRPGFRSWGGKRAKFGTWGGKRGRFATWGGKRSKFNNWGGKRSVYLFPDHIYEGLNSIILNDRGLQYSREIEKKDTFKSWGGKRSPLLVVPTSQSKFSNWGGKRDMEYPFYELEPEQPEKYQWRRREFQSWGGKRSNQEMLKYQRQLANSEGSKWSERTETNHLPDGTRINQLLQLVKDNLRVNKKDGFADAEDSSVTDPWKG